jgi:hypothetical protein
MTISIIVVVFASLALWFFLRVQSLFKVSPQVLDNPAEHLQAVDLEAFRNLMDPDEEAYLRDHLQPRDFRRIQRERLRAAVEYLTGAAHNAAVLMRLGEAARTDPDPATAAAAEKLIANAVQLRLYALQAIPKLYVAMVLPGRRVAPMRVAESYELMTRQVVLLGLRYPAEGVSAALG